jgi:phosphatidylserine decarboxylase
LQQHQYIDRASGDVRCERLIADKTVQWLYSTAREQFPYLFKLATSPFTSHLLAYLNYDAPMSASWSSASRLLKTLNIQEDECVRRFADPVRLRDIFERQIRYWECRPLPQDVRRIASPCDARILAGSFKDCSLLPIKEKFFDLNELVGMNKLGWQECFGDGDWAIFRLTPEKYHYNHFPVDGQVVDLYEIDGCFHSCNPAAVIEVIAPYSKNRRSVTIIDTDVEGGTGVGFVAMIEVVALMIGEIVQCYSEHRYEPANAITKNSMIKRGAVKSLFRPGSSTVITLFQPGRTKFDPDIVSNTNRQDATSRFSRHFGRPLVETDVQVRSSIARPARRVQSKKFAEINIFREIP